MVSLSSPPSTQLTQLTPITIMFHRRHSQRSSCFFIIPMSSPPQPPHPLPARTQLCSRRGCCCSARSCCSLIIMWLHVAINARFIASLLRSLRCHNQWWSPAPSSPCIATPISSRTLPRPTASGSLLFSPSPLSSPLFFICRHGAARRPLHATQRCSARKLHRRRQRRVCTWSPPLATRDGSSRPQPPSKYLVCEAAARALFRSIASSNAVAARRLLLRLLALREHALVPQDAAHEAAMVAASLQLMNINTAAGLTNAKTALPRRILPFAATLQCPQLSLLLPLRLQACLRRTPRVCRLAAQPASRIAAHEFRTQSRQHNMYMHSPPLQCSPYAPQPPPHSNPDPLRWSLDDTGRVPEWKRDASACGAL